jgi:hypothetical protein
MAAAHRYSATLTDRRHAISILPDAIESLQEAIHVPM